MHLCILNPCRDVLSLELLNFQQNYGCFDKNHGKPKNERWTIVLLFSYVPALSDFPSPLSIVHLIHGASESILLLYCAFQIMMLSWRPTLSVRSETPDLHTNRAKRDVHKPCLMFGFYFGQKTVSKKEERKRGFITHANLL